MISSLQKKKIVTLHNGKGPVFSQKVDEISKSEVNQTFSNFFSLIDEYLGIQSWLFLAYNNAKKDTM